MDTLLKKFPTFSRNFVLPSVELMKAQRGMKMFEVSTKG